MTNITYKDKKCCTCKKKLSVSLFCRNRSTKDGLSRQCKSCRIVQNSSYYKLNKNKWKELHKREFTEKLMFSLLYLQEHGCIDCGEKDPIVLEYDHVRGRKLHNISDMINHRFSLRTLKKEIAKCEVRCVLCHRRKTAKQLGWYKNVDWESLKNHALQTVAAPKDPNRS